MPQPTRSKSRTQRSLLGAVAFAHGASAATFTVNSTTDAVDTNPGNGVCETAVGDGVCTLRAAVQEANASGANLTNIIVPAGTYQLTIAGRNEDAAATGDLDILGNLTITGDDASTTIIDASGIDRVFDIGSGANATLTRLTIRGGGNVQTGGGIQNAGALALTSCIVEDNGGDSAPVRFGGGIANLKALVVTNSIVRGNRVGATGQAGAAGGGIYNVLALSINGAQISDNSAVGTGATAGGIFSQDPAVTQIAATSLSANSALQGGGIELAGGQLLVSASLFSANHAASSGGALRIVGGTATLANVTVSGNAAASGGGVALTAGSLDGGNVTLAFNTATAGPAGGVQVASGAMVTLRNSIVASNTDANAAPQPDCSGPLVSQGYLLLRATAGCDLTTAQGDIVGIDPQLAPLADNGGFTFTHALPSSSVAVDAGDPAGCTGLGGTMLVVDQRGSPRPSDGNDDGNSECDLGAYELQSDIIFANSFEAP